MRKLFNFLFATLLLVSINGVAFGFGAAGSDGSNYQSLQETAVFFNNSGETLTAGDVVVLDTAGSGVVTASTLGSYVTTADAISANGGGIADRVDVVGVVKATVIDQRPVIVVTKGPVSADCNDSSDAVTIRAAVGTTGTNDDNARCGGGTNLGVALEAGAGADGDDIRIWVDPTGAD